MENGGQSNYKSHEIITRLIPNLIVLHALTESAPVPPERFLGLGPGHVRMDHQLVVHVRRAALLGANDQEVR